MLMEKSIHEIRLRVENYILKDHVGELIGSLLSMLLFAILHPNRVLLKAFLGKIIGKFVKSIDRHHKVLIRHDQYRIQVSSLHKIYVLLL
jgi:hypothetical protein